MQILHWIVVAAYIWPHLFETSAEREHLGVTRAQFYVALQNEIPDIRVPIKRCGDPLVLRHCHGTSQSGLTFAAADTYATKDSMEEIQAFHLGAEGVLYSARVAVKTQLFAREPFVGFEFVKSCAAMLSAYKLAPSLSAAVDIATADIVTALTDVSLDGEHVRVYPTAFWVTVADGAVMECRLESQWIH